MNITRLSVITTCLAVGMAIAAEPSLAAAKKKKVAPAAQSQNDASTGYPNGRPWQSMESDFIEVKQLLDGLDHKVDGIAADTDALQSEVGALHDEIAGLAAMNNNLQVQVSVAPAAADVRNDVTDAPVTLLVHVSQNGVAVTDLTADDFNYVNSFPYGGAAYCGATCFTAGQAGVYAIVLNGDWSASSYAGSLAVTNTVTTANGDVTSNGSSLVTFDIPAAPVVVTP